MLRICCKLMFRCVALLLCLGCVAEAQDLECYTSGSVAGIVIATIVVTIVTIGLAGAFAWYVWKQRKGVYDEEKDHEKSIMCPPMTTDKHMLSKEKHAFDNPHFKDDNHKTPDIVEKGESRFCLENGNVSNSLQQASNGINGQPPKKSSPFSNLPFHSVFNPSSGKKNKTTMDDTYLSKHTERITVPLRGHDFTGLGFNICGNMRDGIFVKDVLHRGPATESGKIKAGDKIIGVTVSFEAMVYEDALTILSYASPYDVKLELEKCPPSKRATTTSFVAGGSKLFHPLYRSQSIDNLTPGATNCQKDSNTARRSQSIETSTAARKHVTHVNHNNEDSVNKSLTSSKNSQSSINSNKDVHPSKNNPSKSTLGEMLNTKKEVQNSKFRVEQVHLQSEVVDSQSKNILPAKDSEAEKQPDAAESKTISVTKTTESETAPEAHEGEKPTPPPRKISTPKRKAPAPPPVISAVVHRTNDQPADGTIGISAGKDEPRSQLKLDFSPEQSVDPKEENPEKRKASSLGDLTKLDSGKSTSSISSAILERAVSLDLKQCLPEENLVRQKKMSPTYEEDETEGLKRWDNGLDEVLGLTNGSLMHETTLSDVALHLSESKEDTKKLIKVGSDLLQDLSNTEKAKESDKPIQEIVEIKSSSSDLTTTEPTPDSATEESSCIPNSVSITQVTNPVSITKESSLNSDSVSVNESSYIPNSASINNEPLNNSNSISVIESSCIPNSTSINKESLKTSNSVSVNESSSIPNSASINEESSNSVSIKESSSNTSLPPVTISIPIIKPDLTNFEKLPSPPNASTHPALDPSWRISKTMEDTSSNRYSLDKISAESLYKPIFGSKDEGQTEVNGNKVSPTAQNVTVENNLTSNITVNSSPTSVTIKAPNSVAGFAKTLIIPGPSEVENLLMLATEPNTPPPQLDPPDKAVEKE